MRKRWAAGVAFVLVVGLLYGLPATIDPAQAAPPPPVATPATPITGETFIVSGKLSTKVVRPVELQLKAGKKWTRIAKGKTDKAGGYSLSGRTIKASITVRVVAKRTRIKRHTYKAITTKPRVIKTIGTQTATLSMPATVEVNTQVNARLAFTPARNGRPVQLEALVSGAWKKLADGIETADGTSTIQLTADTVGSYTYRAVAPAWHTAASATSNAVGVQVLASQVVTKDVHPISATEVGALTDYDASTGTLVFADAPPSLADVTVGTVVTLPPRDGAPSGVLRKVKKVTVSGSTTTFETEQAALTDAFRQIPDSAANVGLSMFSAAFVPGDGVTVESMPVVGKSVKGAGLRPAALDVLRLTVAFDVTIAGHYRWAVNGQIAITFVTDCEFKLDVSGLKGYRIGGGVQNSSKLTSKVGFKFGGKTTRDLGRWTEVVGGTIGPVPVWMEEDTKLILEDNADGQIGIVTETGLSGVSKSGIENTSDSDLTPQLYSSQGTADTKLTEFAVTGTFSVFLGAQVDLTIYSIIGPFARLGVQAQFDLTVPLLPLDAPRCKLTFGPHAEAGIKTSDDLEKFIGVGFKAAAKVDFLSVTIDICPQPTAAETVAVATPSLPAVGVNHPYQTILSASGGAGGYTWAATGLPDWLSLDPATGALTSSAAADVGSYPIHLTVTDMIGATASGDVVLKVVAHKIATAISSSCLIASDKTVWCWGANQEGELGNGSGDEYSGVPVQVSGLTDAVAIASGTGHNCAVLASGEVWCWGQNLEDQLGDGTNDTRSTPVRVQGVSTAVAISAGWYHTCALLADGTAACWGFNSSGQLGDGTFGPDGGGGDGGPQIIAQSVRSVHAADAGSTVVGSNAVAVKGLTHAVGIAVGSDHSCAVIDDGTLRCWGYNMYGQLGDGTTETSNVPVTASKVSGKVVQVSAGWYHTCVLLEDRTTECWGADRMMEPTQPTKVAGVTKLNSITVGNGDQTYCGASATGSVTCWGENEWGQVGRVQDYYTFFEPDVVSGVSGVVSVAGSGVDSCALTDEGSVYCWGWNKYGELGDGSTSHGYTAPIGSIDYSPIPVGVHGFS